MWRPFQRPVKRSRQQDTVSTQAQDTDKSITGSSSSPGPAKGNHAGIKNRLSDPSTVTESSEACSRRLPRHKHSSTNDPAIARKDDDNDANEEVTRPRSLSPDDVWTELDNLLKSLFVDAGVSSGSDDTVVAGKCD